MTIEQRVAQTVTTRPVASEVITREESAVHYEPQPIMGIFDRAFDLYKSRALTYIVTVAIILLPMHALLQMVNNFWLAPLSQSVQDASDPEILAQTFQLIGAVLLVGVPDMGIPGILTAIAFFIASTPVTLITSHILLGKPISIRRAFRQSFRLLLRQGTVWLFAGLAFIGGYSLWFLGFSIVISLLLMGAAAIPGSSSAVAGVLVVLLFIVPYFLACFAIARAFILATPLTVLEGKRPTRIVERNTQLIPKQSFRKVWLATACLPVALLGLQMLLITSLASVTTSLHIQPLLNFWIQTAFTALLSLFFQPYAMIFFTLLYYDMAFRRDGLDIRLLAEAAHIPAPSLPNTASPLLSTALSSPPVSRRRKR
ncbi:MAG: hypothetical protein NT023_21250 [Armatimonadetes bacterium]|nr:hypothetical protein [Armatimonadota bacterium]